MKNTPIDEVTPRIYRIIRLRAELSCDRCPPHRGENATRSVARKSWKQRTRKARQHEQ